MVLLHALEDGLVNGLHALGDLPLAVVVLSELNKGVEDRAGQGASVNNLLGSSLREAGGIIDLFWIRKRKRERECKVFSRK